MKKLNYFFMCGLMLSASLSFMGCSSDDEEDGAPQTDNYYITTNDGERLLLTRVGNYSFEYDSNGLLSACNLYGVRCNVSFAQNKITDNDGYTANFKLNGKGYISSLTYKNDGEYAVDICSSNFSYDGNGRLVSVSGNYSEDGDKGNFNSKFTYDNGRLTKVITTVSGVDEGERYSETETAVLKYDNGAVSNVLGQYSMSLAEMYYDSDEFSDALFLLGYLGKPSSYFPSGVDWTFADSEGGNNTSTDRFSYSFNSDGTLAREDGMSYSYSNMPTVGDDKTRSAQTPSPRKHYKRHGFRLIK